MVLGERLAKVTGKGSFLEESERFKNIEINDIPVMLCEDGSICCIPKSAEAKSMGFVGNSGHGKSLLMNRVHSHLFHLWKTNVAIMNDVSEETYLWSEEMKNRIFNKFNYGYLNQTPVASPLIYLFPNTKTLEVDRLELEGAQKDFIKIVMPFDKIIDDIGFYLAGVNPDFTLAKSSMYVNDLRDKLIECDTPSQIREVLQSELPGADGKSFQAMRAKILTAFESLFKEEILDITNPECHAYLKIRELKSMYNPMTAVMKTKRIPSLITSDLINKKYKSSVFSYFINALFENNTKDFPNQHTYMIFDELKDICTKEDDPATDAIGRIASRGRIKNVGMCFATQYYNQIPHKIRGAKLNFLFAFKHGDDKIVTEIGKDFNLDTKIRKSIKNLKKFECIAMTQDEFIFYRDDEKWTSSEPVRGRIFYPLAGHMCPAEVKNE